MQQGTEGKTIVPATAEVGDVNALLCNTQFTHITDIVQTVYHYTQ